MHLANSSALQNDSERAQLADSMRQFIRMYNPHEAREDTVLFPAFHKIVTAHEFDSLGEDFEKKENELFGEDGFEKMVDKVAGIEKRRHLRARLVHTETLIEGDSPSMRGSLARRRRIARHNLAHIA